MNEADKTFKLSDLEREKLHAVEEFAKQCTVPIICRDQRGSGILGAGTLFDLAGQLYLVTARHVADDFQNYSIGIPESPAKKGAKLWPIGHLDVHLSEETDHDVAILPIKDPKLRSTLERNWTILSAADVMTDIEGVTWYLLAGFPLGAANRVAHTVMADFSSAWTSRSNSVPNEPFNPAIDILLHHSKVAPHCDGGEIMMPRLDGVSGSSVWAAPPLPLSRIWTPRSQIKVAGIQSSSLHGSYIRAKQWHLVAQLLAVRGRA